MAIRKSQSSNKRSASSPVKKTKAIKKVVAKQTPKKSSASKKPVNKPKTLIEHFNTNYYDKGFNTRAIHAGNEPDSLWGGVCPAIDLSTTFIQPAPGVNTGCFDYQRCGNPTRLALEKNLAALEKTKYAFALASGMSATVTIMNILETGDHVLCVDDVYGGTQRYLRRILGEKSGIEFTLSDMSSMSALEKKFQKNTKIVWLETPTNPTMKIFDIKAISKLAKKYGAIFVVDNTFFTPFNQNPCDLGADITFHSATKYIGGHSDVVMGALCLNDLALYERLSFVMKTMGTGASPFDCYLALRGSKTLGIRVERSASNALACAKMLEKHPKISKVRYPGLKSHPQHELCKKQARGFGGMMGFYVKGDIKMADRFLRALKVFTLAESLGGVESLIENPALMTHGSVPPAHRKLLGIDDNYIRVSVGIEDEADLLADMLQALNKA